VKRVVRFAKRREPLRRSPSSAGHVRALSVQRPERFGRASRPRVEGWEAVPAIVIREEVPPPRGPLRRGTSLNPLSRVIRLPVSHVEHVKRIRFARSSRSFRVVLVVTLDKPKALGRRHPNGRCGIASSGPGRKGSSGIVGPFVLLARCRGLSSPMPYSPAGLLGRRRQRGITRSSSGSMARGFFASLEAAGTSGAGSSGDHCSIFMMVSSS